MMLCAFAPWRENVFLWLRQKSKTISRQGAKAQRPKHRGMIILLDKG
jgi:hypothetical protein